MESNEEALKESPPTFDSTLPIDEDIMVTLVIKKEDVVMGGVAQNLDIIENDALVKPPIATKDTSTTSERMPLMEKIVKVNRGKGETKFFEEQYFKAVKKILKSKKKPSSTQVKNKAPNFSEPIPTPTKGRDGKGTR